MATTGTRRRRSLVAGVTTAGTSARWRWRWQGRAGGCCWLQGQCSRGCQTGGSGSGRGKQAAALDCRSNGRKGVLASTAGATLRKRRHGCSSGEARAAAVGHRGNGQGGVALGAIVVARRRQPLIVGEATTGVSAWWRRWGRADGSRRSQERQVGWRLLGNNGGGLQAC